MGPGDRGIKMMEGSQANSWVSHENFRFLGWHMKILFSPFFNFFLCFRNSALQS